MTLLIGSDPELFMETPNGEYINAFDGLKRGVIKGTKIHPELTPYGGIQVDGMAVEINTKPTSCPGVFARHVAEGLDDARRRYEGQVSEKSTWEFEMSYLEAQHPMAVELGCSPDFNAWRGGETNLVPNMFQPLRTAGGHIHLGWTKDAMGPAHVEECCEIVKYLDYFLGLWSLVHDEHGAKRRQLYGKAGAFRPKKYGLEYRVLSNFWIMTPELAKEAAQRALDAVHAVQEGLPKPPDTVAKAIEIGDVNDPFVSDLIDQAEDEYMELQYATAG